MLLYVNKCYFMLINTRLVDMYLLTKSRFLIYYLIFKILQLYFSKSTYVQLKFLLKNLNK